MSESERESIPQQLRAARRAKGVELGDAQRKTGVSLPVLQGLEAGKYDVVEPVFVRMAFGAYVDYLGLDKDALWAQFDALQGMGLRRAQVVDPAAVVAPAPAVSPTFDSGAVRMVGLAAGALVVLLVIISLLDGDDAAVEEQPVRAAVAAPVAKERALSKGESASLAARSTPVAQERPPAVVATRATVDSMPALPAALEEVVAADRAPEQSATGAVADRLAEVGEVADGVPHEELAAERPAIRRAEEIAVETPVEEPAVESSALAVGMPGGEAAANELLAGEQSPANAPALGETRTEESELAAVASAGGAAPAASAAPIVLEEGFLLLEVEAVDSTWVQVDWDQSGYFQGIVPRGESRRWQAKDFFRVHSGRAHGLRYTFQGKLLGDGSLGEATKVLRFLATAEGVSLLGSDLQPLETAAQP